MSIDFTLYPVDSDVLQRDEVWAGGYIEAREREYWEWQQDRTVAKVAGDPRSYVLRSYSHHYVQLLNSYLDAAYGIEPYSWFARESVSEYYFVTPPEEVAALAAALSRPPDDVRDRLDALARANLDMTGPWATADHTGRDATPTDAIDEFWQFVAALNGDLRGFFQQAAGRGQAMVGYFSP